MKRTKKLASAVLLRQRIAELNLTKKAFAEATGLTPEYISRILNQKVPFPHLPETIERLAKFCDLEPLQFEEYRTHYNRLPPATLRLWNQMRETGMTRRDLFFKLQGRLSRPYIYEILRGDLPFPTNAALAEDIAKAVGLTLVDLVQPAEVVIIAGLERPLASASS